MAITIRNKVLEAQIKAIGAASGKGPTDVLKALIEEHAKAKAERERLEGDALVARRKAAMKKLIDEVRENVTDEQRAEARRIEREMHDDNGLPRY